MNGVYETATGDLLRAGFSTFTAGAGETLRSDVPEPPLRRRYGTSGNMHRWNGSAWVEVAQPPHQRSQDQLFDENGDGWFLQVDSAGTLSTVFDASNFPVISGLTCRLDFSDKATLFTDAARTTLVAEDGDVIGGVQDLSGSGNHASQATTAKKAVYKESIVNSRSIARFDGADDFLTLATIGALLTAGAGTVWAAVQLDVLIQSSAAPYNNDQIFSDQGGWIGIAGSDDNGDTLVGWNYDGDVDETPSKSVTLGQVVVLTWRHAAGSLYLSVDGSVEVGGISGDTSFLTDAVVLCSNYNQAQLLDADFCEIFFSNESVAIATGVSYLQAKWQ